MSAAKNVVLAGVKSVTIYDPEPTTIQDLSSQVSRDHCLHSAISPLAQFFLRREDIGESRAEATLARLAELNSYVPVRNLGGNAGEEITTDLIHGFQVHRGDSIHMCQRLTMLQVVVLCGVSHRKQLEINDWTHENGVHFISTETRGLFG
jgi:ubiquitin-activating enzyme E1